MSISLFVWETQNCSRFLYRLWKISVNISHISDFVDVMRETQAVLCAVAVAVAGATQTQNLKIQPNLWDIVI